MRASRLLGLAAAAACAVSPSLAQNTIGLLEIKGSPKEKAGELAWLFGSKEPTLRELIAAVREAGANEDYRAVVIRLRDAELSRTQVEELGQAIKQARAEGGRKFVVFGESMGQTELTLGSYADQVLVQAGGSVSLPGLYMEEMFLADTLKWAGVTPDFVQIGDYKGASEMFANSKPSPAWDQNINQLLDSLYGNVRAELKEGRKLDDAKLDEAMKTLWMAQAEDAAKTGLVDAAVDLPSLGEAVAGSSRPKWDKIEASTQEGMKIDESNPFAAMTTFMGIFNKKPPTKATGPTIAVVHLDGPIVEGESAPGGFSGESNIGSRTVRNALEEIRDQDQIKGVVLRINSPGGSAVASEIMWQGIRRVADKKPVWVSVGSMAASGGYYLAVAGDKIYVNPSSIVGSIGVVGGKFALGGLFDTMKMNVVSRARGPRAGMFASARPWNDEERALIRGKMQETYDLFTKRVTQGRKGIDLSKTAEGRLFAGQKAVDLKMADKLGTLDDSIKDLAAFLKMEDYDVMDFPAPKPLNEVLEDAFKGFGLGGASASAPAAARAQVSASLRAVVGERNWPMVARTLDAIMVLRDEPVGLVMPQALIVR